ncbi:cytochrome P450 family protein [Ceratobasidium sp. AG-Ba]|nr:cytochrome P450 family protein [Ceratobasidium sp. AG-Ba]
MSTLLEYSSFKSPIANCLVLGACLAAVAYRLAHRRTLLVDIPGPPSPSWVTGHFKNLFGFDAIPFYEHLVSNYGPTVKIKAPFGADTIWTIDPAAMHSVLVKDRVNFDRSKGGVLLLRAVMGPGLIALRGEEHRIHRKILNPVFVMKYLRELVRAIDMHMPVFMNVAERACDAIEKEIGNEDTSNDVDIFPWMTAAALELVGEAGLGYSFESFERKRNKYSVAARDIIQYFIKVAPFGVLLPFIPNIGTPSFRYWLVQYIPIPGVRQLLEARDIQNSQAEEILRARQELLASGHDLRSEAGRGRDILTLLMKANETEGSENRISHEEMIGHMNIFIFAGHETTSTAMSRMLSILASSKRIQDKLREEVQKYFTEHADDTHHDALLELPYLDAVIRETLRLYAPVTRLARVSQTDTVIPLKYPINTPNGKLTSIPVKRGTHIMMNVTMANRYQEIWGEQANEFIPERWIGNKLEEVTGPGAHLPGVYSSMMTFGGGPAACM